MKKVLLGVAGVLGVAAFGFFVAVSVQPDVARIERSVKVAATPADVFPFANDMDRWMLWNPWKDLDPNQTVTFSESRAGVGAWYAWQGNDDVGHGKMTIKESVPDQKVAHDLHFIEPFESIAVVSFTFTPDGDQTRVTWAYEARNNFMAKAFGLFVDMDAMLGADFQKGLDQLKPLVEAEAAKRGETERLFAEAAAAAAARAAGADPNAAAADPNAAAADPNAAAADPNAAPPTP